MKCRFWKYWHKFSFNSNTCDLVNYLWAGSGPLIYLSILFFQPRAQFLIILLKFGWSEILHICLKLKLTMIERFKKSWFVLHLLFPWALWSLTKKEMEKGVTWKKSCSCDTSRPHGFVDPVFVVLMKTQTVLSTVCCSTDFKVTGKSLQGTSWSLGILVSFRFT